MNESYVIKLINKIQDACTSVGCNETLNLPQIVVIGEQSSGKSSVLERIAQRDFLPRGSGIVTRRPLILQLIALNSEINGIKRDECYAEFLHLPNQRFYDFNHVRDEISRETDRIAGNNKGISKMPINLKIYSTNVLNLTLIDLPGLTKVSDQPQDISVQIKTLVLDYITKSNSIILTVTPANSDIANSDSLKLARQVDPAGKRTIGVLTKLDLMDAGTNALNILTGKSFQFLFKLGVVAVVNRSQQDILTNKSMEDSIRSEQSFFENHPSYRAIVQKCGSIYLIKHLNQILVNHVREKLPDLRSKLSSLIGQTQHELTQYGDSVFTGFIHQGSLILKLLTMFSNEFVSSIDGTSSEISTKELAGGARIYFIFNSIFGNALDEIQPCANLSDTDIRTAIRNATGLRCSLFVPEIAFDLLVRPQIKLLEASSLRCVDLVYEELSRICLNTCSNNNKEMDRFPKLHTRIVEVVTELLQERLEPTTQYIESLISIECAYINSNHPDFPSVSDALLDMQQKFKKKVDKKEIERKRSISSNSRIMTRQQNMMNNQSMVFNESISSLHPPQFHRNSGRSLSISSITSSTTISEEIRAKDDDKEVELIRYLITAYFNIVRKTVKDIVPKTIMHLMVNFTKETVHNRLVSSLYREDLFADLLKEDLNVASEREQCKAVLELYRHVFALINDTI
ncbi:MAG: Dynamin central region-domain-containing protein [Benjaminiella poitrasii]|nr:MAG: Dynamin central region-domain-containing protein [Benjaminiella poitrasii]